VLSGRKITIKAYVKPQHEVMAEVRLNSNAVPNRKRTFRIPYFGVGIALLVFGIISLIIKLRRPIGGNGSWACSASEK
jgi:hypothetical protein